MVEYEVCLKMYIISALLVLAEIGIMLLQILLSLSILLMITDLVFYILHIVEYAKKIRGFRHQQAYN